MHGRAFATSLFPAAAQRRKRRQERAMMALPTAWGANGEPEDGIVELRMQAPGTVGGVKNDSDFGNAAVGSDSDETATKRNDESMSYVKRAAGLGPSSFYLNGREGIGSGSVLDVET